MSVQRSELRKTFQTEFRVSSFCYVYVWWNINNLHLFFLMDRRQGEAMKEKIYMKTLRLINFKRVRWQEGERFFSTMSFLSVVSWDQSVKKKKETTWEGHKNLLYVFCSAKLTQKKSEGFVKDFSSTYSKVIDVYDVLSRVGRRWCWSCTGQNLLTKRMPLGFKWDLIWRY